MVLALNSQPIEKVYKGQGGNAHSLDVIKIWPTIQGEGPFAGRPAVFVRLAGCNLMCPWCDTDYTTDRKLMGLYSLVARIQEVCPKNCELVVLTGGEPFRQDIAPLCYQLWAAGLNVQIETNGTAWQNSFENIMGSKPTIVCSPKTGFLHGDLLCHIDAYKYVVQAGFVDPKDGLPTSALGNKTPPARPAFWPPQRSIPGCHDNYRLPVVPIYVQPLDQGDEKLNADNTKAAVDSCMKFGYTFCFQVHKAIGME